MRMFPLTVLAAACVLSQSAFATGFCDDPSRPLGADCRQTRSTHVAASGSATRPANAASSIAPDYSSLDLSAYADSPQTPLTFVLDIGALQLVPAAHDQDVSVLELGIAQSRPSATNPNDPSNDRVLSVHVVRHPNGTWALRFVWLQAAATWSIVDGASGGATELVSADAALPATISRVSVNILPADAWARFDITVSARQDSATALPQVRLANLYAMPAASPPTQNLPARLRTGVLGGDLVRAGMVTQYWFTSPAIDG